MSEKKPQGLENHPKIVPAYHYLLSLVVVVNLLWSLWRVVREPASIDNYVGLLVAVGLAVIMWFLRIWPLTVQDRLIRLEETLRMREVLPEELRGRIGEIRRHQFVALRFAPDEELPELVKRVLDGELRTGKEIKKAIRSWKADYFRV
ncbi:MAG: DUF6526 family protein [Holophagales bacterium]|nr:DUF6526 family protein [Holophagales bacterium]